jgi:hypothetical protein
MMEPIKAILDDLFHKRKIDKTLHVYRIFKVWDQAVGRRIASHSQPKRYRNGTLWIVVDSPTWMQQLTFLAEDIRGQVNQALGSPMVEKIRFQLGEVRILSDPSPEESPSPPEWSSTKLDAQAERTIEHALAPVSDEGLKERLRNLFKKNSQLLRHHGKE